MNAALDRSADEPQATFADHKRELIECLHKGWCRGPREKPFDPERAWYWIELAVAVMTKAPSTAPRELRDQALELAEALGKVLKILDRAIKVRPELADQITLAWTWLATGGASAISVISGQTPTDGLAEKLQQAIEGVVALEAAANLVAQWNHQPRGRQQGSGRLPGLYVLLLSGIYKGSTGLQPTTTETGLFMDFMRAVRGTFNLPLCDEAVHRAVKFTLRHIKSATKVRQ